MKEIRTLDPAVEFVPFHTDAGKEFLNADLDEVLTRYKLAQTNTGGRDPQANGLAERFVGILKGRAASYLAHAKMSLKYWYLGSYAGSSSYEDALLRHKIGRRSTYIW